ncbi:hypothetical protein QFC20_003352 [Naganishia adeliensis]|uniref:Uncharacterized protein n=1 Tax=Naganishia adeliensis TaxID=92952 RepID=A0ACC2WA83_9TREE|nr:hypothetical protein QFC20_003352 [Naganishia adeliensis]
MPSVDEQGFKELAESFTSSTPEEKQALVKKACTASSYTSWELIPRRLLIHQTNGIFQLNIKNKEGKEVSWVIDAKEKGEVTKGAAKKADCTISMTDETFSQLADGKQNAQKLFMTGGLKVKGNIMLATKLDSLLKTAKAKL